MLLLQVIGHLGKDATVNTVGGKQVINFSVAHSEKYKDAQGNPKEKTTWADCAYWSDSKVSGYLKKGTLVYVSGTPEVRTFAKNDGTTGTSLSVRVNVVNLLGGTGTPGAATGGNTTAPAEAKKETAKEQDFPPIQDDLPF